MAQTAYREICRKGLYITTWKEDFNTEEITTADIQNFENNIYQTEKPTPMHTLA